AVFHSCRAGGAPHSGAGPKKTGRVGLRHPDATGLRRSCATGAWSAGAWSALVLLLGEPVEGLLDAAELLVQGAEPLVELGEALVELLDALLDAGPRAGLGE